MLVCLVCVLVLLYWSVLLPVDDGCGVFHAYQTVISQLRENYHFMLRDTQRLRRTLNPSCIQQIVVTFVFLSVSLLSSLYPGVMMVILCRNSHSTFPWTIRGLWLLFILWLWALILLLVLSLPSPCAHLWCIEATNASDLSILILFHHLQTQK